MKNYLYFLIIFFPAMNIYANSDSTSNPYAEECVLLLKKSDCPRYSNCRLIGGSKKDCENNDTSTKISESFKPSAEQKALRDAENKIREYERSNAGRLCSEPVVINGKIVSYIQAPCR